MPLFQLEPGTEPFMLMRFHSHVIKTREFST